ncbi:MAG: hypothetical protein EXR70_17725 [Deltaproteobacteria bacterium]|nr:hypothetical protein [Deltaproteobacteria bacterium]
MAARKSYDQPLRVIGQSLEAQRIGIFELRLQGEGFVVRGEPEEETSLLAKLVNWQKRNRSAGLNGPLVFTTQDLDELERQGRSRRSKPNRLPDFHSLPNTLRTVGSYLEEKGAELIELRKKDLSITLLANNKAGHPEFEERGLAWFYDLFVDLHGKRKPNSQS